jgi:metal-dependent hydrolase (beta-lactamase superfamily II)
MGQIMQSKFSFFKARQGSFYGGRIWNHENNRTYTIVYDCGTSNFIKGNSASLNNEITLFKNFPKFPQSSNDIELLFISHLDYDHVSGIKRLLNEFNVKRIILPYIEKQNRQFFLVSFFQNEPPNSDTDDLTLDSYIAFIERPHQFIQENSDNTEVYFVRPNEGKSIEYRGYESDNLSEEPYPVGTSLNKGDIDELSDTNDNIYLYDNNLQFFYSKKMGIYDLR